MTYDNIRRQYAVNAEQLKTFAIQAERTGRKVRGMTAEFWQEKARIYSAISTADDETIAEYLRAARQSVSERLKELRTAPIGVPRYSVRAGLRARTLSDTRG